MKIKITTLIINLVLFGNHFTNAQCPEPYISYGFSEYFCGNSLDLRPIIVMPLQGTFSSSTLPINSITGEIIINHVIESSHTITYSISGLNTCPGVSTSIGISLHPSPTISGFDYFNISNNEYNIFCKENTIGQINPTPSQPSTYQGGYFFSSSGLIINATTGGIDIFNSPQGTYDVIYVVPGVLGCPSVSQTTTVTINLPTQPATINYESLVFCQSGVSYPPSGNFVNGHFQSPDLNLNSITGAIDLYRSPVGAHIIEYFVPEIGGCPSRSTNAVISITSSFGGSLVANTYSLCPLGKVNFSLSGYSGDEIIWQQFIYDQWVEIGKNKNMDTITLPYIIQDTYIRAAVSNNGCPVSFSNIDTVKINTDKNICPNNLNYITEGYNNYPIILPLILILGYQNSISYCIEIGNDSLFNERVYSICGITSATYHIPSGILSSTIGKKYYWHVATVSGNVQSNWSHASSFIVEGTTGISSSVDIKKFEVYPNPSNNSFTIENYQKDISYKIVDIIGVVRNTGTLNQGKNEINSDLSTGIYYLLANGTVLKIVIK